ncbi:MAG TPA: hypothetical protein VFT74_12985, partial [Isosphaeraceae bacterium]|nr:hypothetical protein [Isosphaeraceae bacterium]
MSLPVDVGSLDTIKDFRAHLVRFGEDAKNALASAEMEITRMVDWLTHDRRFYWEGRIKFYREELSQAKSELHRKRTSNMFGGEANMGEQRENLRDAKRRLEEAEEKLERVRRWIAPMQQAIMEYRSRARPLGDMVDGDIERSVAMLDRMILALEEYLSTAPESTTYVKQMKEEKRQEQLASVARPTDPDSASSEPSPQVDDTSAPVTEPPAPSPDEPAEPAT